MYAVIFEVEPEPERRQDYLDIAARLRPELERIDGFVSVERFQSLTNPGKILSLSFWRLLGANVETMTADHHDLVLAITSHLPHLIAYTIVSTADEMQTVTRSEVLKFSAGGFRDFTRIAASDPVMWRDIFLANREAVLELLQRFSEDLTALQRAIRRGEGDTLHQYFTRTRAIRRSIIEAKQA